MNRKELVRSVATAMREQNVRKLITYPKHVFHLSDDFGNRKDFVVRQSEKGFLFTVDDVEAVIDTCLDVIKDALKRGEPISVRGFGTLWLKYRKPRQTKIPGTEDWVDVESRYIPKFDFGNDLRRCAKIYEISLTETRSGEPLPILEDEDGGADAD